MECIDVRSSIFRGGLKCGIEQIRTLEVNCFGSGRVILVFTRVGKRIEECRHQELYIQGRLNSAYKISTLEVVCCESGRGIFWLRPERGIR